MSRKMIISLSNLGSFKLDFKEKGNGRPKGYHTGGFQVFSFL